ncbi:Cytochrome P450 [Rhypophila decipiens]
MIFGIPAGAVLAYVAWTLFCLELNVRKARAMKVPVIRLPIDPNNIPWLIFQPWLWAILDRFPFDWKSFPDALRFSRRGWHFYENYDPHLRLGPVWALVTPVTVILHIAEPGALNDIFWRRKDFLRPVREYELLRVYGHSISTAGSEDWARHRKVLAPPFSENMMSFVWEESVNQATAMMRSWDRASSDGIPSMQKDTRTLSLNVLASIGLRKSYPFHGTADPGPPVINEANSYRDSLQTVLDNIILLLMIPYRYLTFPLLPQKFKAVGNGAVAFKSHMQRMLDDELSALARGESGSGGLMTGFAHALEVHKKEAAVNLPMKDKKGLSVEEVFGNLFVINFAGHDTTANTLAFAILLLITNPDVQEWVAEEVMAITQNRPPEEWTKDYKTVYPKLKRCRAVLLESLRLYPSIVAIPKYSSYDTVTLHVASYGEDEPGQTLVIPPRTSIISQVLATQTHPLYWTDGMAWKPKRWIVGSADEGKTKEGSIKQQLENEEIWTPDKTIYFPWSDGPLSCLGRKLSEVEFVAVLACMLQSHRLSAKPKFEGETEHQIRQRVGKVTNEASFEMLLKIIDADRVRVVCKPV